MDEDRQRDCAICGQPGQRTKRTSKDRLVSWLLELWTGGRERYARYSCQRCNWTTLLRRPVRRSEQ
ncbi:MAG: hypothetical protein AVDCRST_MAG93-8673 [uncultured Chloroflexia bacterium]|uniref:Uncharacterized protein n=1 Tax=uncultured Chloroflexia bacterium TaxID=1672391 RepID=A0A6J4N1W9_9CHLR|nr:MAG: hypothetical protein AVDCRST_MAG93-8673 [uncultured Chloroflexia bacterium]